MSQSERDVIRLIIRQGRTEKLVIELDFIISGIIQVEARLFALAKTFNFLDIAKWNLSIVLETQATKK